MAVSLRWHDQRKAVLIKLGKFDCPLTYWYISNDFVEVFRRIYINV
jgi:hypothetical protein